MKYSLRTLLIMTAVFAVVFLGLRGCMRWLDPFAGRSFSREVWREFHDSSDPDNPRASMVASLKRRHLKSGTTREEVIELLGEPDMARKPEMYEYNLGMWSGFRMDYDGLQIHFDEGGRLKDVRCVQH